LGNQESRRNVLGGGGGDFPSYWLSEPVESTEITSFPMIAQYDNSQQENEKWQIKQLVSSDIPALPWLIVNPKCL